MVGGTNTLKITKLGTALLEILKGERNTGDKLSPGPWGLFNLSLNIGALGDQKTSRLF